MQTGRPHDPRGSGATEEEEEVSSNETHNNNNSRESAGFDKHVVDRIHSPLADAGDGHDRSRADDGVYDEGQGAVLRLGEPLPREYGHSPEEEGRGAAPSAVEVKYTEEEQALLRSLSSSTINCFVDGNGGPADEEEEGAPWRGSEGARCPHATAATTTTTSTALEESMDAHDYLMMTETLREVGNPLLQTQHDPTLSTSDAGLGGMPDLAERIDVLVRPGPVGRGGGEEEGEGKLAEEEDRAERRARRRRPLSFSSLLQPESSKGQREAPATAATARLAGPPTIEELRPQQVRRRRRDMLHSDGAVPTDDAQQAERVLRPKGISAELGTALSIEGEVVVLREPSPRYLADKDTALAAAKADTADAEVVCTDPPRPAAPPDAVVISSSASPTTSGSPVTTTTPSAHAGKEEEEEEAVKASAEEREGDAPPVTGKVKQNAGRRRLKLTLGSGSGRGGGGGMEFGRKKGSGDEEVHTGNETANAAVDGGSGGGGSRLRLKGATTTAVVAAVAAAVAAADAPPRKVLRLGPVEAPRGGGGLASPLAADGGSPPSTAKPTPAPLTETGSPAAPVSSPRAQRPPPIADPGSPNYNTTTAASSDTFGASSPAFSPTIATATTTRRHEIPAPATISGGGGGGGSTGSNGSGTASRRLPHSPLSPRRVTGDANSAYTAFVTNTAASGHGSGGGGGGGANGLRHRSRTPTSTPTPTPTTLYNLSDATPHRTHAAARVPLPLAPVKVDFSVVSRWVEDTYEVTEKISEGTYGEVYKGRVKASGEPVALKRLKTLRGLDGFPITSLREVIALQHINRQRRRLVALEQDRREREAEECRQRGLSVPPQSQGPLHDPLEEIVELRDVLLSQDSTHDIYLAFNYANSSMAGLLSRRFPFTLPDIAYIFRKIVLGVHKLHDMGIIHRDIKTDNVLLSQDGAVQLADFGLCVFEGSGARALTPSMINLSYRPPEMLLGSTQYDKKVDIWSIGCFLAQVFLHQPPFYKRKNEEEQARVARHNRSAETELEQLSAIAEVLGPVTDAPADAFPASTCAHLADLQKLQAAVLAASDGRASYFSSSHPHSPSSSSSSAKITGVAAGLSRMEALFKPSFSYGQFRGFRRWFASQMDIKRTQYILSGGGGGGGGAPPPPQQQQHPYQPPPPLLLPSPACIDVLDAIFQYDPRRRPTAAQLLDMPFFQLYDRGDMGSGSGAVTGSAFFAGSSPQHAPLQQQQLQDGGADALVAREQVACRRLAERLRRVRDSHLQPPPKAQGAQQR